MSWLSDDTICKWIIIRIRAAQGDGQGSILRGAQRLPISNRSIVDIGNTDRNRRRRWNCSPITNCEFEAVSTNITGIWCIGQIGCRAAEGTMCRRGADSICEWIGINIGARQSNTYWSILVSPNILSYSNRCIINRCDIYADSRQFWISKAVISFISKVVWAVVVRSRCVGQIRCCTAQTAMPRLI